MFLLAGYPQRLASAVTDLKTFWGLSSAEKYRRGFDDPVFFDFMERVRLSMSGRGKVLFVVPADVDEGDRRGYYYYYYRANYLLYPHLSFVVPGEGSGGQESALQRALEVAQERHIGRLAVYCARPCPEAERFLGGRPLVTGADQRGYLYDLPRHKAEGALDFSRPRPDSSG